MVFRFQENAYKEPAILNITLYMKKIYLALNRWRLCVLKNSGILKPKDFGEGEDEIICFLYLYDKIKHPFKKYFHQYS
jgi:hypothetical protein